MANEETGGSLISSSVSPTIYTDWANITADVLWLIIKQLPMGDYLRFGDVCASWRTALAEKRCQPAPTFSPWLMLSYDCNKRTVRFHNLADRKNYTLHLPRMIFSGHNHIGSCLPGWLHSLNSNTSNSEVHMFHPLSRVQIRFPPISSLFSDRPEERNLHLDFCPKFIKVVLMPYQPPSSTSTSTTSFVAAAATSHWDRRTLGIAKQGDKSWTTVYIGNYPIIDVIFYKEKLYGLTWLGKLVVCDISDVTNPGVIRVLDRPPNLEGCIHNSFKYLVESSDELLLVWRRLIIQPMKHGGGYESYDTAYIEIFKMDPDPSAKKKWVELKSLGDNALFLGESHNHSLSVSIKDVPELSGSCIYLLDKQCSSWKLRAYHMGNKSFIALPKKWRLKAKTVAPVWFIPTNNMFSC